MLHVACRADGSEADVEVRGAVLELQGRRFFVLSFRDVTEWQQQARQAAALAQAAASVAASDSIDPSARRPPARPRPSPRVQRRLPILTVLEKTS